MPRRATGAGSGRSRQPAPPPAPSANAEHGAYRPRQGAMTSSTDGEGATRLLGAARANPECEAAGRVTRESTRFGEGRDAYHIVILKHTPSLTQLRAMTRPTGGVTFAVVSVCLLLTACPRPAANDAPDGGDAGEAGGSAGGGGGSGGGDGGGAAGGQGQPDDACDYGAMGCDAGLSCMPSALTDGGQGRRCLPGACDLWAQDCAEGFKCSYADGGRSCVLDGLLDEGAACASAAVGCKKGLVCTLSPAPDGGSACARFCRQSADCDGGQQCYVSLVLPDTVERPLTCSAPPTSCDPLAQDCADGTQACYPGATGSGCFVAGAGGAGAPCEFSNDCQKGTACVGGTGARSCRALCRYPQGEPSCATQTCTRLTSSMTIGVCL